MNDIKIIAGFPPPPLINHSFKDVIIGWFGMKEMVKVGDLAFIFQIFCFA